MAEYRVEIEIVETDGLARFVLNVQAGNRFIIHVANAMVQGSALTVMASVIDHKQLNIVVIV